MAARKLQQEVDKCFKKVAEGVQEFEGIYEKIEQSNNPAQKEKLEDNLKREIKKLQRLRDQIKTWAASNDIKDKQPLLDQRRLIETQMEKFKAVEKAMKTKAYSKEGLSAAAKLDPKEQAKVEAGEFISSMIDDLEQQIEALEAESEQIQATSKKGKVSGAKAERMGRIDEVIEQHKWHQGKLEKIGRHLENGGVEPEQVNELEEEIRYYVTDGINDDYMYDEEMYDVLDLEEDDALNGDQDKGSSQDTPSIAEEPEPEPPKPVAKKVAKEPAEPSPSSSKKPSVSKSPLPALATLHTPLSSASNGNSNGHMKAAPLPTRPAGEGLKYASAAAAAAANDSVGISPLPPPPGITPPIVMQQAKKSATSSPAIAPAQPATTSSPRPASRTEAKQQAPAAASAAATNTSSDNEMPAPVPKSTKRAAKQAAKAREAAAAEAEGSKAQANGQTNGIKPITEEEEESIYHLPSSLRDLVESHEASLANPPHPLSASTHRQLASSLQSAPDALDADAPRLYTPSSPVAPTASNFPRQPLPIFDDPRLYGRIDPDTLFYVFYYKQGTPQQYLAAKALKDQSWRFHKQYQTWFQRHEEPKNITEEFEQGTYRFFDYESTWMNRRKADFKFAYKFLEDEV